MDISQFELVYKPQSPAGPADTVLQGYFLKISNLEDDDLFFALRLTTSSVSDPDRSLFGNAAVFVDTPGTNNNLGQFTLTGGPTAKSFGLNRLITVPAHGTALVAVLPSDPFPPAMVPSGSADFECRGYAALSLPPILQVIVLPNGQTVFALVPQGSGARNVLITAQSRAVYTDTATGEAKGQTQSSLPLASGQSMTEIEPDPPFFFARDGFDLSAIQSLEGLPHSFEDMLASMLATASQSDFDLKKFNAGLKKSGVGMAIETRKI